MLRRADQAALYRIIVQIVEFLEHDFITRNGLCVGAFLPDLKLVWFVRGAIVAELIEQPLAALCRHLLDNEFSGITLDVAQDRGKIGRR